MRLYDGVVLTKDIPEHDPRVGDSGAIVEADPNGLIYMVEFFSPTGETLAVLSVDWQMLRPAPTAPRHARRRPRP